jgi:hypothetical protein
LALRPRDFSGHVLLPRKASSVLYNPLEVVLLNHYIKEFFKKREMKMQYKKSPTPIAIVLEVVEI